MSTQPTYTLEPKQPWDNGRVDINAAPREKAGIDPPVEATFILDAVDGEDVGREFTAYVDDRGRFYIPNGLRDRYGIEDGDWVDISVVAESS